MNPRELRTLLSGLIHIDRDELEEIGAIKSGPQGDLAWSEFSTNPCRAALRFNEEAQTWLVNQIFKGK